MSGSKLSKIINPYHPWHLRWSSYLVFANIKTENAILDATVFDMLYFTTHTTATRKLILLTSVFPPTCVTRILTKLRSELKTIWLRDAKSTKWNIAGKNFLGAFWPSKLHGVVCLDRYFNFFFFFDWFWPAKSPYSWNQPSNPKPCSSALREVRISHSSWQMQHLGSATGEK